MVSWSDSVASKARQPNRVIRARRLCGGTFGTPDPAIRPPFSLVSQINMERGAASARARLLEGRREEEEEGGGGGIPSPSTGWHSCQRGGERRRGGLCCSLSLNTRPSCDGRVSPDHLITRPSRRSASSPTERGPHAHPPPRSGQTNCHARAHCRIVRGSCAGAHPVPPRAERSAVAPVG